MIMDGHSRLTCIRPTNSRKIYTRPCRPSTACETPAKLAPTYLEDYDCHLAAEWPLTLSNAHWLQARRALPLTMEGQAWMTFDESRH